MGGKQGGYYVLDAPTMTLRQDQERTRASSHPMVRSRA